MKMMTTAAIPDLDKHVVEYNERLSEQAHALLCVVAMMDETETLGGVKVHLDSMPSLTSLFTPLDGRALYLCEAIRRWVDMVHADPRALDPGAHRGGVQ